MKAPASAVRNSAHRQPAADCLNPTRFVGGARSRAARPDGRAKAADPRPDMTQKSKPNEHPHPGQPELPAKPHRPQGLPALTPRENEVLGWLAEGKRDAEIGAILGTSVRTIHKHVQRIFAKLGVETRTAAARLALTGSADRKNS